MCWVINRSLSCTPCSIVRSDLPEESYQIGVREERGKRECWVKNGGRTENGGGGTESSNSGWLKTSIKKSSPVAVAKNSSLKDLFYF